MISAASCRHIARHSTLSALALLMLALTGCTTAVPDGGVNGLLALATPQPDNSGTAPPCSSRGRAKTPAPPSLTC
jgi:hypothetical protein